MNRDFPNYGIVKEEFFDQLNNRKKYVLLYGLNVLNKLNLKESIYQLYELKKLILSEKELTEIPKEIGHLHNLQYLHLANNNLKKLPKEIGNLHNLEIFYLYIIL